MKKITTMLFAVVIVLSVMQILTSCANDTGVTSDVGVTDTSLITESETIEENTVTLNTDLLDEYMMTSADLMKKHGKITGFEQIGGGNFYFFENGYTWYLFYIKDQISKPTVTDPDGEFEYWPLEGDEVCRGTFRFSADKLFLGDFETISIEKVSNMEGLNFTGTNEDGIVTSRAYASYFTYDGWNSDNVQLIIYHDEIDKIDETCDASIYIHPIDIRAEESEKILSAN